LDESRHTGTQIAVLNGHSSDVNSVSWSPDGSKLASSSGTSLSHNSDNTIRVWDALRYFEIAIINDHTNVVNSVCWSKDGTKLASGSYDKTIRVWVLSSASGGSLMKNYNIAQRAIEHKIKAINNKLQKFDGKFKKINIQNIKYKNKNGKYELEYNV